MQLIRSKIILDTSDYNKRLTIYFILLVSSLFSHFSISLVGLLKITKKDSMVYSKGFEDTAHMSRDLRALVHYALRLFGLTCPVLYMLSCLALFVCHIYFIYQF